MSRKVYQFVCVLFRLVLRVGWDLIVLVPGQRISFNFENLRFSSHYHCRQQKRTQTSLFFKRIWKMNGPVYCII